nr:hypothetical protein [Verminephrobacter eiseniae]
MPNNGDWLKDDTGTWVNLASEPYGGKVSTEGGRTRLDFQLRDGGQYDADGQVNGSPWHCGEGAAVRRRAGTRGRFAWALVLLRPV